MADTFREVIADMFGTRDDPESLYRAESLLNMPEMEQIRQYINGTLEDWCCIECRDANVDLSKSVIDWVLGEEARREQ